MFWFLHMIVEYHLESISTLNNPASFHCFDHSQVTWATAPPGHGRAAKWAALADPWKGKDSWMNGMVGEEKKKHTPG